jgi:antitoxin HicB
MNQHLGRNFDDFLAEEGILVETQAMAWKRVIACRIAQLITKKVIRPLPYVNSESNLS